LFDLIANEKKENEQLARIIFAKVEDEKSKAPENVHKKNSKYVDVKREATKQRQAGSIL
jgi:hypothetical protein